jgi:hypothetical protein
LLIFDRYIVDEEPPTPRSPARVTASRVRAYRGALASAMLEISE